MGGFFMEKMMIPDNYKPIRQVGNGKTVSFSFDFPMLSENFIKVYREQDGVQELVDPSEYVWGYIPVEGEDAPVEDIAPENVITFYEAPADGVVIVIAREIPLEQTTPYKTSSGFPAVRVEDNFDKLTAITQQLMEEVDRCVKVEITNDQTSEELLAEVYGKLDSATEVAQEAVDAAKSATEAVASAEKTLADVTTYVDTSKTEIDALITKTTDEIDKTIAEATEEIKEAAVAEAETAIAAGVKVIEDTATEATGVINTKTAEFETLAQESTKDLEDNVEKARIWAEGEQAEVEPLGGTLSSMGAADLAYAIANAPEDTPIDASGLFAMNVVKGEKGDKGDKGEDGKDGGGLEIGDVAFAVMGIDETKNLRRYLNGQVISQAQFVSFSNWVKERAKLYPNTVATEENWQAEVTNSKLGQCGKFVIDDELGTIRLPKVVNINGLQDLALMGSIKAESLPNISGNIIARATNDKYAIVNGSGAFETNTAGGNIGTVSYNNTSNATNSGVNFDASRVSSAYQDNAPVQQEAIQYPYFIQVATGVEESVDVTREIELNNPFSLLDYKWSEYELNNASWLLSNGAFHSGTVYKAVYELLLKLHNGTETKDGVSVKLSTEAYEDTDFVINTADTTFRLPIKVKLASGNAIVGNGMTLGLTDGTYDYGLNSIETSSAVRLGASQGTYGTPVNSVISGNSSLKNTSLGVTTDPTKSGIETSSSGLKLYFYVGETIQDANVINASGVLNQLAGSSKLFDGQWIASGVEIFSSTAVGTYNIDLSEILPDDGYNYEILLNGRCYSSSSNYSVVTLTSGSFMDIVIFHIGTNNRSIITNTTWIVDSSRQITIEIQSAKIETWYDPLSLVAYRRIGTNR